VRAHRRGALTRQFFLELGIIQGWETTSSSSFRPAFASTYWRAMAARELARKADAKSGQIPDAIFARFL
jgi:hypothetical protein